MKHLLVFCFLVMALSGCVSTKSNISYISPDLKAVAVDNVCHDIAEALGNAYPAGQTLIVLENSQTPFELLLEEKLRLKGFLVQSESVEQTALKLLYTLDMFEQDQCYIKVNMSDGFSFARSYTVKADQLNPGAVVQGRK